MDSKSSIIEILWIAFKTWVYNRWHKARINHKLSQETLKETLNQVEESNSIYELIDNLHGLNK